MKLKDGMHAAVVNPPSGYPDQLKVPREADLHHRLESGPFDWVQVFVKSKAELESLAPLFAASAAVVSLTR